MSYWTTYNSCIACSGIVRSLARSITPSLSISLHYSRARFILAAFIYPVILKVCDCSTVRDHMHLLYWPVRRFDSFIPADLLVHMLLLFSLLLLLKLFVGELIQIIKIF
jgi:hypothetical protein